MEFYTTAKDDIIFIITIVIMVFSYSFADEINHTLLSIILIIAILGAFFLKPLYDLIKKVKAGALTLLDKIFFIIKIASTAILLVSIYSFVKCDYNYWLANKAYLSKLSLFSFIFIFLSYLYDFIKRLMKKREKDDSTFKLLGTILLAMLNLYLLLLPLINVYSAKEALTLPVMKKPKSITIYLKDPKKNKDSFSSEKTVEFTDGETIDAICNSFSNSTIENLRNLDELKFYFTEGQNDYYKIEPKYEDSDVSQYGGSSIDDLKNGYLPAIEVLPNGYTSFSILTNDIHKPFSFNPFKPRKYSEQYIIRLSKDIDNKINEAVKK